MTEQSDRFVQAVNDSEVLPDPTTLTPEDAGTWVGRMMWAFRADDPRSEFIRRLGLRIAEFRL